MCVRVCVGGGGGEGERSRRKKKRGGCFVDAWGVGGSTEGLNSYNFHTQYRVNNKKPYL